MEAYGVVGVYALVVFDTTNELRAIRLLRLQLGIPANRYLPIILLLNDVLFSAIAGVLIFVGTFLSKHNILMVAALLQAEIFCFEGFVSCFMLYDHHMLLTYDGTVYFTFFIWLRVVLFFISKSHADVTALDNEVSHQNFKRDSFVLPSRRHIADEMKKVLKHKEVVIAEVHKRKVGFGDLSGSPTD